MLYRVMNPDLAGLENEGAYLLICKAVLPVGMLGLMLGGMVFATASSVNTTLNLSAAVLTNDIYKVFSTTGNESTDHASRQTKYHPVWDRDDHSGIAGACCRRNR